jgi:heat shock protein HslJ
LSQGKYNQSYALGTRLITREGIVMSLRRVVSVVLVLSGIGCSMPFADGCGRDVASAKSAAGEVLSTNVRREIDEMPCRDGEDEHLASFIHVSTRENGGGDGSATMVHDTYWRLVGLGDGPVVVASGRREPHVRLVKEGARVQGSTGCNMFAGIFKENGETLRFGRLATTRMACKEGMAQEQAFLRALEATVKWRILAEGLELYGAGGELLARFEAVRGR